MMGGEENHSIAGEIEGAYDARRGGGEVETREYWDMEVGKFWVILLYINFLQNTDFYGYDFFLEVFIRYSQVELFPSPALVHRSISNQTGLLSWLSQKSVIKY